MSTIELTESNFVGEPSTSPLRRKADGTLEDERAAKRVAETGDSEAGDLGVLTGTLGHTSQSPTIAPQGVFPFLLLPAEIRVKIYKILFQADEPIYPPVDEKGYFHEQALGTPARKGGVIPTSMLSEGAFQAMMDNERLSREVKAYIFRNNIFYVKMSKNFVAWLKENKDYANLIQRIVLLCPGRSSSQNAQKEYDNRLQKFILNLRNRFTPDLRELTLYLAPGLCDGRCVGPLNSLVKFSKTYSWREFPNLTKLVIKTPVDMEPAHDRFEKIFLHSQMALTAIHGVPKWDHAVFGEVDKEPRTLEGTTFLSLTFDTMGERLAATPEAKKWAERLAREEQKKEKERLETRARAQIGAWVSPSRH